MDRSPPHNIDAEQAVLGSMIIDPHALAILADTLKPAHFYRDGHRQIFAAALELQREGTPADLVTICDRLEVQDKLEAAGGADYLTTLVNATPDSGNAEYYAKIVFDAARGRACLDLAGKIATAAYAGNIDSALDLAMRQLVRLATGGGQDNRTDRSYATILEELRDDVEARKRGDILGLRTGFHEIDLWTGGIEPGSLILLAGRPGSGKSALGLAIARRKAAHCQHVGKGSVLVVTMEMSAMSQARRLVASRSDPVLNTRSMRLGFREGDNIIDTQAQHFTRNWTLEHAEAGQTLWFADGVLTMEQLAMRVMRAKAERGLELLVIDQLDLFGDEAGRRSETERIGDISKGLKQLARRTGVPILCLVQLNRKVEERPDHRPEIADLRQSGRLEQDADAVMALYRPAAYFPYNEGTDPPWYPEWAELLGLKCRDGQAQVMMPLRFIPEAASYTDWHTTDTQDEETFIASKEKPPERGRAA